jgi:hypothetical protein
LLERFPEKWFPECEALSSCISGISFHSARPLALSRRLDDRWIAGRGAMLFSGFIPNPVNNYPEKTVYTPEYICSYYGGTSDRKRSIFQEGDQPETNCGCACPVEMYNIRHFLRFGILVAALELPAIAGNVTLAWNANPNPIVTGYNIYYWMSGGAYLNMVSAGNAMSVTISNLVAGTNYIFAATTHDASGLEGPLSPEVSFMVPAMATNQSLTLGPIGNVIIIQSASDPRQGSGASQTVSQSFALTGITSSTANQQQQTLTITATSSNPALIPKPSAHYSSPDTTGTLTITSAANATGTATITVVVNDGGNNVNTITNTFTVTVLAPGTTGPALTSQLTNKLAVAGQPVNFGITATGTGPLTYQWQFNGLNLVSATNAALTMSNVNTDQTGTYSVLVSNVAGSTNSNPAALTVYATAAANLTPAAHASGQFGLAVVGVPGYPYAIQASTDLVNWVSIGTNIAPFTFTDTNAGRFGRRFYRSIFNP